MGVNRFSNISHCPVDCAGALNIGQGRAALRCADAWLGLARALLKAGRVTKRRRPAASSGNDVDQRVDRRTGVQSPWAMSGFEEVNYYFRRAARVMDLSANVERS